jgi:histidinol-phosphate aminotransferase
VTDLRLHGDRFASPGLLDLAVNVQPGPRPAHLEAALGAALAERGYPDPAAATAALARRHGRPPGEVLPLNGACEAFWLLAHAVRPRVAACVHPSFTEPEAALRAVGARVHRVLRPATDWRLPPAGAIPDDAQVVVLGHPNNPTGTLDAASAVASLARPGRLLVVDESFIDLVPGERESLAARRDLPGLVVVRSLTKLWTLPGIRAGYLLAPADVVAHLAAHRQAWSVNALALAALVTCAEDRETPARVAREVAAGRDDLRARLAPLPGLRAWPSAASFLLLRGPRGAELPARLRERGIAVRPAGTFPGLGPEHLRVAVRGPAEHARLAAALGALLA